LEPPECVEQLPAVITIVHYIVISIPVGVPPRALHAESNKEVCKLIRDLYSLNDQQYLFVIRNGELGRILRTRRGLVIRFKEAGLKLTITPAEKHTQSQDGWIGD
jgi:hypothetical protein